MANLKITFIGAGSSVFMKNIVGDILQREALGGQILFGPDKSADVMKMFAEYSATAPVELDLSLVGPGDTVFHAAPSIEYYYGVDSDGNWSEGSQYASVTFASVPGGCVPCTTWLSWLGSPSRIRLSAAMPQASASASANCPASSMTR